MKLSKSGAALAATAAIMLVSGTALSPTPAGAEEAKVQCFGVNSCKGMGACKTAKNDCKGQNSCKGLGFVSLTKTDCMSKGGKLTQS